MLLLKIRNILELTVLFFCLGVGAGGSFLSFSVPAGSGKKMLGYGLLGGVSTQADAMREWIMYELWWGDWPCIFTKMRNSWYKTIIFCYWWWFLTKAAINNFLLDFAFAIFWFYILQLWPFWTAALPEVTYEFVFVHSSICPLVSSQCKISEMVHQCFLMLSKALESHKVKNVAKLDFWKKVPMTQNWGFGEFDKNRIYS